MKRMLATIVVVLIPTLAWAHGGGREVKGTIVKTTKNSVQVKSTTGKVETFAITSRTKFEKGKVTGTAADMRTGSRVIVHLAEDGKVVEIQLPAEKVGTLEARIVGRDVKKNELKVEHKAVKGIVPARTTQFHVHDGKVSALPKNGTRITARVHASGSDYWLTNVKAVQ